MYSKIDAKGGSWYYILDGIASLTAGYLFVINNYIPIYICLSFIVISTFLSFGFKDIYEVKKDKKTSGIDTFKEYGHDLKMCFSFMLKSNRMKAFLLFQIVFYSLIEIINTYRSDLLVNIGIPEQQFSMIFAILTLIGGISLSMKQGIEKRFKNRTLSFLSLMYIISCIIIGSISIAFKGASIVIPIILSLYAIQTISTSIWYILEYKYLKNFTKEDERNKITFAYEFIGGIVASTFSILGGLLLEIAKVEDAFLIVGVVSLIIMLFVLKYMKTRFGLKPEEYKKQDIEFETVIR